ncbi:hypothetical protein F4808DRAFT_365928 [Astrocystis sublimbata]|nr:hypothetical protein F4808DRAFT_365928 [Astrocystis sublimbata]
MNLMQLTRWFVLPQLFQHAASLKLNVTAVGARDGVSTLECWQLDTPFDTSSTPGTSGSAFAALGNVSTISYTILPSNFDGGQHNAPENQWVIFLSGIAYITLPYSNSTASATVIGGEYGLIFAADTSDVSKGGHRTQYPGITETIAIQIPVADGQVPKHDLVHDGPCGIGEIAGLRSFALPE